MLGARECEMEAIVVGIIILAYCSYRFWRVGKEVNEVLDTLGEEVKALK